MLSLTLASGSVLLTTPAFAETSPSAITAGLAGAASQAADALTAAAGTEGAAESTDTSDAAASTAAAEAATAAAATTDAASTSSAADAAEPAQASSATLAAATEDQQLLIPTDNSVAASTYTLSGTAKLTQTLPALEAGQQYGRVSLHAQIKIPDGFNNGNQSLSYVLYDTTNGEAVLLTVRGDKTVLIQTRDKDGNLSDKGESKRSNAFSKTGDTFDFELEYRDGLAWFRYWWGGGDDGSWYRPKNANGGAIVAGDGSGQFASFSPDTVGLETANMPEVTLDKLRMPALVSEKQVTYNEQAQWFDKAPTQVSVGSYDEVKDQLPELVMSDRPDYVDMYNGAWRTMFNTNVFNPAETYPGSPFSTYVGSGFNPKDLTFQWDSIFAMFFAKYANGVFDPMTSLDNFYHSQYGNGEIYRIYNISDGSVMGWAQGANKTNPPIFVLAELQYYELTGDKSRLEEVAPALQAYADWVSINNWSQGEEHQLYWNNGDGNGMDNLPIWGGNAATVDMSSEMVIMWNSLAQMDDILGNKADAQRNRDLASGLKDRINKYTWDSEDNQYYETRTDNGGIQHHKVNSIAEMWTLWSGVASTKQAGYLRDKLMDPNQFYTDMPFAALAADDPSFNKYGDYWNGGSWAPTNYMAVKGLEATGFGTSARQATEKYLDGVSEVYQYSGTFWENYSPTKHSGTYVLNYGNGYAVTDETRGSVDPNKMYVTPGTDKGAGNSTEDGTNSTVKKDFTGWTAVGPITMTVEDLVGITPDVPDGVINWTLTRTDENGVKNVTLGDNGTISLVADARADAMAGTTIHVTSSLKVPLTVKVDLNSVTYNINVPAGDDVTTEQWVGPKADVQTGTVTVKYVDEDGTSLADDVTLSGNVGDAYTVDQKSFDGYTFKSADGDLTGTFGTEAATITLTYAKDAAPVSKDALDASVAKAQALKESDYTAESWQVLQNALKAAEDVQANDAATQDEVDAAQKQVDDAVAALVKADTGDNGEKPGDNGDNGGNGGNGGDANANGGNGGDANANGGSGTGGNAAGGNGTGGSSTTNITNTTGGSSASNTAGSTSSSQGSKKALPQTGDETNVAPVAAAGGIGAAAIAAGLAILRHGRKHSLNR